MIVSLTTLLVAAGTGCGDDPASPRSLEPFEGTFTVQRETFHECWCDDVCRTLDPERWAETWYDGRWSVGLSSDGFIVAMGIEEGEHSHATIAIFSQGHWDASSRTGTVYRSDEVLQVAYSDWNHFMAKLTVHCYDSCCTLEHHFRGVRTSD